MEQMTESMAALVGNQNRANTVQCNNNHQENLDGDVNDEEEEEYYEEPLFIDTANGEDEDAVIRDEPIFDEDDDDWLHNNIFSDY